MAFKTRRQLLGQHFLRDRDVITRIANAAETLLIETGVRGMLEIGPGKGALTHELVAQKIWERWTLVEKDHEFAAELTRQCEEWTRAHPQRPWRVVSGDFLDLPGEALEQNPSVVVSNLPYSSGTPILLKLAEAGARYPAMVLMFQKEVAQRIAAPARDSHRGSLSLHVQNLYDVDWFLDVPPRAFVPPPKVDSAVLILRRRPTAQLPQSQFSPEADKLWQELLRTAFAQRRKMLRSGLGAKARGKAILAGSGVDPTLRPEALEWPQWSALFDSALRIEADRLRDEAP